ncbi:respiratory chain complex I subunit 1 family protein [Geotalea uraniireducens]|uniref:Formate hydrogenlyase subunit 4-like protein n=1 Tax=Geotalea uraniireducens (strain Rf4) TaxID=351605 RepID=A5GBF8_GEOUR|nr:NADH-quinone oxidoreductase subunit H [Geotalea uraniireducens]ABQ25097.1 Formate hydrogenlyase subunit 4-like protein [Geotalea uraniireducens Rf4]
MTDILIHMLLTIFMPPLLLGVIGKTKAAFAGRVGAPFLQPYYDLAKLIRKGSVFSDTTTWIFRAGPIITLAATLVAALLIPLGNHLSPISFAGDMILFAYLFALGRFFTTTAALDTGSSFEGMGAAREVTFACLAEPTLFFALMTLSRLSGSLSLSPMLTTLSLSLWFSAGAALLLLVGGMFIVLLAENCRIPFDDPTTHLELTMIHEVMVLDHSGPAFAYILYGAALKLFVFGAFFIHIALPLKTGNAILDWGVFILSMLGLAVTIGVVESIMARLRLLRIPQLLVAACILSAFSMLLILR